MNRSFLLAVCTCLLLTACSVTEPESPSREHLTISYGAESVLATATVSPSGGTLTVPSTADTLAGLTIETEAGAYRSSQTVAVSFAPITGVSGATEMTVLSPMIIVDNGGDEAETPMIMTVPVTIPEDMFAMAFAYNENDGTLEGMPILDQDENGVALWTSHFAHSAMHELVMGKATSLTYGNAARRRSMFVIIGEKKAKVMAASISNVPFVPGTDDWAFTNRGSILAPKGHCAGQSMGMMYYFFARRLKGRPGLTSQFDNDNEFETPGIWQDNASAYRYCSVLQTQYREMVPLSDWVQQAMDRYGKPESFRDSLQFMAFKLAMHRTRTPQFVTVWSDQGGGHAMVAYGATAGSLKICDPNYPGRRDRAIEFSGRFVPYNSASNMDEPGKLYQRIRYLGITSAMRWTIAAREFPKIASRTVGITEFPSFTIKVRDSGDEEFEALRPGWISRTGKLMIQVTSPTLTMRIDSVFLSDGKTLSFQSDDHGEWFSLPRGRNQIGFYVTSIVGNRAKWCGFRWAEIVGTSAPSIVRCSRDADWFTILGMAHIVHTDSSAAGRKVIFQDFGEPADICTDFHIRPHWEVTGDLTGMKVTASAYWGLLWGHDVEMTGDAGHRTADMEIGLKQAYGDKPATVGLAVEVVFPSRGDLATDLEWLRNRGVVSTIMMEYKQHSE